MSDLNDKTEDTAGYPLRKPIHQFIPSADAPPWRDNAFLGFWSPETEIYGSAHVSTSPNAEGRRARFSISVNGQIAEVVEPLEPGTFKSVSIDFDHLNGKITVRSNHLNVSLEYRPLFAYADFAGGNSPSLIKDEPLRHYQQGVTTQGSISLNGQEYTIRGNGMNDRTWGYRDESKIFDEYIAMQASFPTTFITVMTLKPINRDAGTEGFRMDEQGATFINGFGVTRDASGLYVAGHLTLEGSTRESCVRSVSRRAGFWVPMGFERRGPTFSSYSEFHIFENDDGEIGAGYVEQAVLRKIF